MSTQEVAAMATAVRDICSSSSAFRQGRGASPRVLVEVLGNALVARAWPREAIRTALCALARPESTSALGTGGEGPVPQPETYGLRGGRRVVPYSTK